MIRGRALLTIDSQVIEADGEALTPHITNAIDMLAGQRYSVIVGINIFIAMRLSQNLQVNANQTVSNYWINAPFVGGNPANNLNRKYLENSPLLHGSDWIYNRKCDVVPRHSALRRCPGCGPDRANGDHSVPEQSGRS
jgi:hypothetical protein